MKKLILIAATAIISVTVANAQSKEVDAVKKKLEKNDAAVADAKKNSQAATWIDRANVMIDVANVYTSKLIQGFDLAVVGNPTDTNEVEFKETPYIENVFPNFNVYTNVGENTVLFWTSKQDIVENPIIKAYDALVKAKELNTKEFIGQGKGVLAVGRLQAICQSDGMAMYLMDKPAQAYELFYKSFEAGELTGTLDTVYLYYAGITAFEAQKYNESIKIMDKVVSYGDDMDGMAYYYLSESYNRLGDTKKCIESLETAFTKYPQNNTILGALINIYLTSKQDPVKIITKIQQAQQLDPTNTSLYMVESNIYNELGDRDKAYATLDRAIKVDPMFFNAYYNYAIMKILEAQSLREKADNLDVNDNAGYEKLMNSIVDLQTQAIDKLEEAHKINPKNVDVIDLLKQLYFARRDNSSEEKAKYEYYEQLATQGQ